MSTYEANRYAFPASAITSGTFANARLSSGSVTQHVDLTSLSADNLTSGTVPSARLSLGASDIPSLATSKITSGTFDNARISSGSVTQHVSAVTNQTGSWSPSASFHNFTYYQSKYVKVGRMCFVTLYGKFGSAGSMTPEDSPFYWSGLPFTSWNSSKPVGGGYCIIPNWGAVMAQVDNNSNRLYLFKPASQELKNITSYGNRGRINRNYSGYPGNYTSDSYRHFYLECTYITAS